MITEKEFYVALIDEHIPSLTSEDAQEILTFEYPEDMAIRTCACGKRIDGFYEYADHLKEVIRA